MLSSTKHHIYALNSLCLQTANQTCQKTKRVTNWVKMSITKQTHRHCLWNIEQIVHSIVKSTSDSNIYSNVFLTLVACKKEEVAKKGSVSREDVSTFVGLECFLALRRASELLGNFTPPTPTSRPTGIVPWHSGEKEQPIGVENVPDWRQSSRDFLCVLREVCSLSLWQSRSMTE